ncbi:unnamed protein product [Colias eurytheme]|nr:unnamed protein product [Colias eurytheme]
MIADVVTRALNQCPFDAFWLQLGNFHGGGGSDRERLGGAVRGVAGSAVVAQERSSTRLCQLFTDNYVNSRIGEGAEAVASAYGERLDSTHKVAEVQCSRNTTPDREPPHASARAGVAAASGCVLGTTQRIVDNATTNP